MFLYAKKIIKRTFRWAKLHLKKQCYMNRLLSLKKVNNPPLATPLTII